MRRTILSTNGEKEECHCSSSSRDENKDSSTSRRIAPLPVCGLILGALLFTFPIADSNAQEPVDVMVPAGRNSSEVDQTVTITATGFSTSAATNLLIKQTPPAVVSISATQPNASKDGPVNGVATVSRIGSVAQPLTVSFSINDPSAGNNPHPAVNGVDFQQLTNQVIIPTSASSATITVIPIPDNKHGPELTVILQLVPSSNGTYTIQ